MKKIKIKYNVGVKKNTDKRGKQREEEYRYKVHRKPTGRKKYKAIFWKKEGELRVKMTSGGKETSWKLKDVDNRLANL